MVASPGGSSPAAAWRFRLSMPGVADHRFDLGMAGRRLNGPEAPKSALPWSGAECLDLIWINSKS